MGLYRIEWESRQLRLLPFLLLINTQVKGWNTLFLQHRHRSTSFCSSSVHSRSRPRFNSHLPFLPIVLSSKTSSNDPEEKRQEISERDVPGTPSLSKNRAISALSQPTTETDASPPNEKDKNGSGSVSNRRRRLGSRKINTRLPCSQH